MRINWVFADTYQLDISVDLEKVKAVGPIWGSWRTWRGSSTDNVICHDLSKAQELLARAFQSVCNFYVPKKYYQDLGRPLGVKLYEGEFEQELDHAEDIVAMHLTAQCSDIIILAGFNFGEVVFPDDRFEGHKLRNYHGLARQIIQDQSQVQWVLVDSADILDKSYQSLPNLTCDQMQNVLKLLS
jgi:hypothetical protein